MQSRRVIAIPIRGGKVHSGRCKRKRSFDVKQHISFLSEYRRECDRRDCTPIINSITSWTRGGPLDRTMLTFIVVAMPPLVPAQYFRPVMTIIELALMCHDREKVVHEY